MARLSTSRFFNHKLFKKQKENLSKGEAQQFAKKLRKRGFNARVVKYLNQLRHSRYAVYSRKKSQGYNARMDESLGMRRGASRTKRQSMKSRRDESKGMSKSMGRRAYASVRSMDKGRRTRR